MQTQGKHGVKQQTTKLLKLTTEKTCELFPKTRKNAKSTGKEWLPKNFTSVRFAKFYQCKS